MARTWARMGEVIMRVSRQNQATTEILSISLCHLLSLSPPSLFVTKVLALDADVVTEHPVLRRLEVFSVHVGDGYD